MKLLTIVGARPQFVKAAAFSYSLKKYPQIKEIIVHTGQHYDKNMSEIFFSELKIPEPDYLLSSGGKSHGAMTGYQLAEIESILVKEHPDWVIVYGDTNSTLAGALAAAKLHIPIAHIEAGLRSFNMKMPEEVNRIITDRLSTLLFCPTEVAKGHLIKEGFEQFKSITYIVGDIMHDAIKLFSSALQSLEEKDSFILCTLHRAENTDVKEKLISIVQGLNQIAAQKKIILPIHPRAKIKIKEFGIRLNENIHLVDPLSYTNFISHMNACDLIISDSGGIQKEAYFLKKNCIILRDETEWTELTERKNNVLVGTSETKIFAAFINRHKFNQDFSAPVYGNGNTAEKIIQRLIQHKA